MWAAASFVCLGLWAAQGATPFTSATITKVQNRVTYGERQGDRSASRVAAVMDVVRSNNFLRTESESRAELQYPDGTLVRVGQNTVFTFDADSRTLSLEKGTMLFHMPKGAGGGTIKTASLTAAITGTAGKVSTNIIAITDGTVTLVPSGKQVGPGQFAIRNGDGSITVDFFDKTKINEGALVKFNGEMPGFFAESNLAVDNSGTPPLVVPDLRYLDILTRSQNLPSTVNRFSPPPPIDRRRKDKSDQAPPPTNQDNPRPTNY